MASILIAEDRAVDRKFLVTLLGRQGHTMLEASDGREALEMYLSGHYALVLTGASSGDPYAAKYTAWRRSFVSTLRTKFAYPEDHVIVLAEKASAGDVSDVSDISVRAATRDEVRRTLVDSDVEIVSSRESALA